MYNGIYIIYICRHYTISMIRRSTQIGRNNCKNKHLVMKTKFVMVIRIY